jgi:hypothetical protein
MDDTLWSLFNSLDCELLYIGSLSKGTRCIREHEADANAETDLLKLAADKLEESQELLKEMQQEHRKLDKKTKKDEPQPPE